MMLRLRVDLQIFSMYSNFAQTILETYLHGLA